MEVEAEVDASSPWEALDVDDSDLPTLLRPCKRRRSPENIPPSQPPLSPPKPPEQQNTQPSASTSRNRTIPGPAGAVQAAMLRKNLDRESDRGEFGGNNCGKEVICTQEYVRRAMDDTAEFDDDFNRSPWMSALKFIVSVFGLRLRELVLSALVKRNLSDDILFVGVDNGVIPSTPISSIKKCLGIGKVDQVVAVIKTCTPNGLGGLTVTLKDPTGTVGASIHHKVLSESEFGKNITTGAVVILQKVAVFSPVRSTHYLNITSRNLVKVVCQDSATLSEPNNYAHPIQYADPNTGYHGKANTLEKASTVQNMTMKVVEHGRTRSVENSQNFIADMRTERTNPSQDASDRTPRNMRTKIAVDDQEFVHGTGKGTKESTLEDSLIDEYNNITNSAAKSSGAEIEGINEVQVQRLMLKPSLPQWTDEQLDELFASDDEDLS